jgi:hypothetical protein
MQYYADLNSGCLIVIKDYTFFLNHVARAMGASFLFLPIDTKRLMNHPTHTALLTFCVPTRFVAK